MTKSLYLSYDGLLEPLGRSQVLPYVISLADAGVSFWMVSFEKPADLRDVDRVRELRRHLSGHRIRWTPLRYHKAPTVPATAWDILRGVSVALWLTVARRIGVIHARSYVAAVIGDAVKTLTGAKLIFDMRGFWPEERVDGRLWAPGGRLYRAAKWVEARLLRQSDVIVVLTNRAKGLLASDRYRVSPRVPMVVIPCCTDVSRFAEAHGHAGGAASKTLVYAGSVGTWYMLEEMLDFFVAVRELDPDVRLLLLNRSEHGRIEAALGQKRLGAPGVSLVAADFAEMPQRLAPAFAGFYFITPSYSKLASSPTKLAEYLAAGLPVIVNADIGDSAEMVAEHRVGVVVDSFEPGQYRRKWIEFAQLVDGDAGIRDRCRDVARKWLSTEYGASQYRRVYEAAAGASPSPVRISA
jgi:glycosyltransferase involved in cell wall biosynthesis